MQPIRSANDTSEYRRNYGSAEFVNALYALDNGYSGQGVVVGVIDDGVNIALSEFTGQIDFANSKDFGYVTSGGVRTKRNELGSEQSTHGTPIGAIIAARRDGQGTMGYAPNAKLAILRIDDWNADTNDGGLVHAYEALGFAAERGIKIVNMSLTSNGSTNFGKALSNYAGATKGLVTLSAGNAGNPNPGDASIINASNIDSVIFVVSSNSALFTKDFGLASYSNKAGTMMERTVTAPGTNVSTKADGTVTTFSGTSSAAPVVAAIAANILSKWPQLSGQQAGSIILNTARDLGAPGTDEIFGRGMVDAQRALSPINPTLSNGMTQTSINSSVMVVGGPFNMTRMQEILSNVTVLDEYGRDYTGSIAQMIVQPQVNEGHWLRRRMNQMATENATGFSMGGIWASLGFATDRVGVREDEFRSFVTTGKVGYVKDGYGVRASWNGADDLQSDVMGIAPFADTVLAYAPQADNSFGVDRYLANGTKIGMTVNFGSYAGTTANAVTLGWSKDKTSVRISFIDESGTLMGMPTGSGSLRLGRGATTASIEAHRSYEVTNGWSIEGYGSVGVTRLKIDSASLVTDSTPIVSSRIGVQASAVMFGGMLSFGVAQPLTIETGAAKLTYGTGYDLASQSLTYSNANANLAGDRKVMLTAGYATGGPSSSFRMGVGQNVGDGSVRAIAGYRFVF